MKNDELIRQEYKRIEREYVDKAIDLLRKYSDNIELYIADIVASLCNVDVNEMFDKSNEITLAQARWLYWHSIRYLTNDTYDKIARRTNHERGCSYMPNSIGQCINKMSALIEQEPMWKKRWTIIKRIIRLIQSEDDCNSVDNTITINIPKEMKRKLNLKIEEK